MPAYGFALSLWVALFFMLSKIKPLVERTAVIRLILPKFKARLI